MSAKTLCLFDVDGTITAPRKVITTEMFELLQRLRREKQVNVGLVGGSDFSKIAEQVGGEDAAKQFDYLFSENGLVSFRQGTMFHRKSIVDAIGESSLQRFINFTLAELSRIELPFKRGTFIEFRNGMINVSPVGRNCTATERDTFEQYDHETGVRRRLVEALDREFGESLKLSFVIGGQISFDVFPRGWDKRYSLRFVTTAQAEGAPQSDPSELCEHFDRIYFFGDKTFPGGNDHEIYNDSRVIGHSVNGPDRTFELLNQIFFAA